jgi:DNA-binding IclR family transcriptional regulator
MSNFINSVERALDLLLYISREEEPVGVSHISKAMGMHKSTVFRTLATLESKQFVVQDLTTGKYSLGVALFSISRKTKHYDVFKHYTLPLAKEFRETVNISVLEKASDGTYRSTIVAKEENSDNSLSVNPKIGTSVECYCCAVGKCLLAFSRDVSVESFTKYSFIRYTDKTIADPAELVKELARVRAAGYAVDDEEKEVGLTCVAVPILDSEGWAVAAMSFSGPTVRICSHDIEVLARSLQNVAAKITTSL